MGMGLLIYMMASTLDDANGKPIPILLVQHLSGAEPSREDVEPLH